MRNYYLFLTKHFPINVRKPWMILYLISVASAQSFFWVFCQELGIECEKRALKDFPKYPQYYIFEFICDFNLSSEIYIFLSDGFKHQRVVLLLVVKWRHSNNHLEANQIIYLMMVIVKLTASKGYSYINIPILHQSDGLA